MNLLFLVGCVLVLNVLLCKGGALFMADKNRQSLRWFGGATAWVAVIVILWGLWQLVGLFLDAISGQFHYISVITLAALALGAGFLYQMVITGTQAGYPQKILSTFFQLLFFSEPVVRKDMFEEHERKQMQQALDKERGRSKDQKFLDNFGS